MSQIVKLRLSGGGERKVTVTKAPAEIIETIEDALSGLGLAVSDDRVSGSIATGWSTFASTRIEGDIAEKGGVIVVDIRDVKSSFTALGILTLISGFFFLLPFLVVIAPSKATAEAREKLERALGAIRSDLKD